MVPTSANCFPHSAAHNRRLADLALGAAATVSGIAPDCQGAERRRLMDLGIVPGTHITSVLRSPGGDPTAYLLRGTLIAIRVEQARSILIDESTDE